MQLIEYYSQLKKIIIEDTQIPLDLPCLPERILNFEHFENVKILRNYCYKAKILSNKTKITLVLDREKILFQDCCKTTQL